MRVVSAVLLTALTLTAVPAFADDTKPADTEKKICRRIETTGSILGGKRQCHTKAEWKSIDDANNDAARRFSDRRSGTGQ